jgi:hypothetical protein
MPKVPKMPKMKRGWNLIKNSPQIFLYNAFIYLS